MKLSFRKLLYMKHEELGIVEIGPSKRRAALGIARGQTKNGTTAGGGAISNDFFVNRLNATEGLLEPAWCRKPGANTGSL